MEINKTKCYEIFKLLNQNRDIKKCHVESLVKSIRENNLLHLNPIIVNSSFQIVDGQHRLEAAKILGEEVYYFIDDKFKGSSVILLNVNQRAWSNDDYAKYWAEQGNKNYIKFIELMKDKKWKNTTCISLISHGNTVDKHRFKEGKMAFPPESEIDDLISFYEQILEILKNKKTKPDWMVYGNRFIAAIKKIYRSSKINNELFLEKLMNYPCPIVISESSQKFTLQFLDMYNWRAKYRVKLVVDGLRFEIV